MNVRTRARTLDAPGVRGRRGRIATRTLVLRRRGDQFLRQAKLQLDLVQAPAKRVAKNCRDADDPVGRIGALDAGDESHQSLNRLILSTAMNLAEILGCELDVVCAYPSLGQTVGELQVAMDYDGIKADMRETRQALIDALVVELDAPVREVHLLEGSARDAIPELANRMGAVLTVLGTAARRGLSQLILGNTAEAIIGALDGDLVTIREPARS